MLPSCAQHLNLQVEGDWVFGSLFYACMRAKSPETALEIWRGMRINKSWLN